MFAKLNHVSRLLLAVAGGLSLLAVAPAYAEEELEVAPGFDQCIADSGYNDRAMADCTYQAVEYWDSQLNANYNELRQYCNELGEYEGPEVKSECLLVIKSTQLVWIKYRDAMEGLVPLSVAKPWWHDGGLGCEQRHVADRPRSGQFAQAPTDRRIVRTGESKEPKSAVLH